MISEFFIGVDLGQRKDPTALAIIERCERLAEQPDPITWNRERIVTFQLRHVERMALGSSYTIVVQRIERIARKLAALGACSLVVDATGVGLPVIDSLRIPGAAWRLMPVIIGYNGQQSYNDGFWRVPKRDLIAGLQLAFDAQAFTICKDLKDTPALLNELISMRATRRLTGVTQYASPGSGHDDLAIALALAWWAVETRKPTPLGVNTPVLCR